MSSLQPRKMPKRSTMPVSQRKAKLFLQHLRTRCMNVAAAARDVPISRSKIYELRQMDPEFAAQWAELEEELLDDLEERQYRDARVNPEDRRWILARRRRDKWGDKQLAEIRAQMEVSHNFKVDQLPTVVLEQIVARHFEGDVEQVLERLGHQSVEGEVVDNGDDN